MRLIGVRHESMHAIAWYLGRPDWRTIEHPGAASLPIGLVPIPDPYQGEDTP